MIRSATKGDIIDIMDDRLQEVVSVEIVMDRIDDLVVIEIDGFKMAAIVYEKYPDCEIHILCPKMSVRYSRNLCNELIQFLSSLGYSNVITSVQDGYKKAFNLALKLGFIVSGRAGDSTILTRHI